MRSRIVHLLAAGIFASVLTAAPVAAQPSAGPSAPDATCTETPPEDTSGITVVRQGSGNVICVNWDVAKGKQKRVRSTRFTARAPVTVHVYRFNFLRFNVQYNVEEEAVESYRALEKLWSQVFVFVPTSSGAKRLGPETTFDGAVIKWMRELDAANAALDSVLATWEDPALSRTDVDSIARLIPWANRKVQNLVELRTAVDTILGKHPDLDDYARYEARLPKHERVVERFHAFTAAAAQTRDGKREVVQPSASGTIVTVTMVAKNQNQAQQGRPVTLEYFVESRMPVVFHTGLSWTGLRDVEFEQVRALNDEDLWAKTKDDESSTDLTAFLSYPISALSFDAGPLNLAFLPTIGTELSSPGKTIFLGGTVQVARRLFITGGYASGEVAAEGDAVIDRIGTELETRELFDAITRRRKWGPYISISFGVIN